MGYSVSVTIRSPALQARMREFLEASYRPWPDILDEDEETQFQGPTDELEYAHAKHQLGFNYSTGGGAEREYVFALIRWMALHIGRRRSHFRMGSLDRAAPYYVYDGAEVVPVLHATEWATLPSALLAYRVDPYGLRFDGEIARGLAWYYIPEGTYERVSVTHQGKSSDTVREALIESGIERARTVLQFIRAEIARLDVLWTTYGP
jgi:hypothetical protein